MKDVNGAATGISGAILFLPIAGVFKRRANDEIFHSVVVEIPRSGDAAAEARSIALTVYRRRRSALEKKSVCDVIVVVVVFAVVER